MENVEAIRFDGDRAPFESNIENTSHIKNDISPGESQANDASEIDDDLAFFTSLATTVESEDSETVADEEEEKTPSAEPPRENQTDCDQQFKTALFSKRFRSSGLQEAVDQLSAQSSARNAKVPAIAAEICSYLHKAAEGILTACSKFAEADAWLDDEGRRDLYDRLPWSSSKRSKARTIGNACDKRFKDEKIRAKLPASISHLYELAILPNEKFGAAMEANLITAGMNRKDVKALKSPRRATEPDQFRMATLWRDQPLEWEEAQNFYAHLKALCAPRGIWISTPKPRHRRNEAQIEADLAAARLGPMFPDEQVH